MKNNWQQQDPELQIEISKYSKPIPSRTYITMLMQQWGVPISHQQLCDKLGITDNEQQAALMFRLKAMCRDAQLMNNRRGDFALLDKMSLIKGKVIGHSDGFGFVKPDDGSADLRLSPRQMQRVFDGDLVLVRESNIDYRGRREGKIVDILARKTKKLVGRFSGQEGFGYLLPENKRITQKIIICPNPDSQLSYTDGQLVVVQLTRQPDKRQLAQAVVVEVLGEHLAAGMEIKVAIHNYDIPHEWSAEVLKELEDRYPEVKPEEKNNRIDLRLLPLVTIDGEDAKDFDDAVYAEAKPSGGWRLWVAIADVSWYVLPDTALDKEAQNRANSTYFPEYVVPMLPELLSNGLCSLKPQVDRLAMVCEMTISKAGNLSGYQFYEALISSHARLTYSEVGQMLMNPEQDYSIQLQQKYAQVLPGLHTLHQLYFALRAAREKRGAIDFETTETRILFGENRKIEQIVPVKRNDAHRMIEEAMLCANVATARLLTKLKIDSLYRVHQGPKEQKLQNLRAYLAELGIGLAGGDKPQPIDYQQLAEQIAERPDKNIIQTMMLRSMQQAVYSPENKGHFGLAYPAYTHFTSPIRRYPDLVVHRLIRSAIHSGKQDAALRLPPNFKANKQLCCQYSMPQLLSLGEHCSTTERRSDEATRDVESWLKCEYMQAHVGDCYQGVISAVTGFGVFVELTDLHIEGLVHVTALAGDYYIFDQAKQRLIGERTRKTYRLGDPLYVQVVRVELDERKIDFEIVSSKNKAKTSTIREQLAKGEITKAPAKRKLKAGKSRVNPRKNSKRAALLKADIGAASSNNSTKQTSKARKRKLKTGLRR